MKAATLATLAVLMTATSGTATAQIKPPPPPVPAPSGAEPAWSTSQGGAIPPGSQATGYEPGGFLYSCRGQVEGGTHPGKVRPGFDGCYVPVGGREVSVRQYQVFTGSPAWTIARDGTVPEGAVEAGRTRSNQILYVCRAAGAPGQLQPGKTGAGLRGCNIGVGGVEQTQAIYEVLVLP